MVMGNTYCYGDAEVSILLHFNENNEAYDLEVNYDCYLYLYVHMAKEVLGSIWETSVLAPQMNNAKWNSVMQIKI